MRIHYRSPPYLGGNDGLPTKFAPDRYKTPFIILSVIAGFLVVQEWEGSKITVYPESEDIFLRSWTWWGLSRSEHPMQWRFDSRYSHTERWMAKDGKGEWYIAVDYPADLFD